MNSDRYGIVKRVVGIVVSHANPERIWLFGSSANGEATTTSDIDIAFNQIREYLGSRIPAG